MCASLDARMASNDRSFTCVDQCRLRAGEITGRLPRFSQLANRFQALGVLLRQKRRRAPQQVDRRRRVASFPGSDAGGAETAPRVRRQPLDLRLGRAQLAEVAGRLLEVVADELVRAVGLAV